MSKEEFDEKLKVAGLSKKEFAGKLNITYKTVLNWSSKGVPYWVNSWLDNYIKAKHFDVLVCMIEPYTSQVK